MTVYGTNQIDSQKSLKMYQHGNAMDSFPGLSTCIAMILFANEDVVHLIFLKIVPLGHRRMRESDVSFAVG